MYKFINLDQAGTDDRRRLLDYYGQLAQISVILPLLCTQVYFLALWANGILGRQSALDPPSSPRRKEATVGNRTSNSTTVRLARVFWWCGEPVSLLGYEYGTRGELVCAVLWTAWLLALCFLQTGDDYLHMTKRFGIVASSQLPLQYLLALKSPYSPLQWLTRSSHETLNKLHQLLGRITTVLLYAHAALYLNFYVAKSLLAAKVREPYVICGIVGIIAFTAVGTTALAPVRKWSYRVFYTVHVTLAMALLPLLFFHVTHIRVYLYETAAVFTLNAALRAIGSQTLSCTVTLVEDSNLVDIIVAPPKYGGVPKLLRSWQPGQHAYLSLTHHPFLRTFRSNPFTVASIPAVDGRLRFVARILDGNTLTLARCAESNDDPKMNQLLTIEGPYGVTSHANRLLSYDRVLFVAGGIGATFIVPIYRQLLADLSPSKGSYRRQKVSFVWSARSLADITWALPAEASERESFLERLQVHLTGGSGRTAPDHASVGKSARDEPNDGIELEEQHSLVPRGSETLEPGAIKGLLIHDGRPDLVRIIENSLSSNTERVAVMVCGPRGLSQGVRRQVGRQVAKGGDVWFWNESFDG